MNKVDTGRTWRSGRTLPTTRRGLEKLAGISVKFTAGGPEPAGVICRYVRLGLLWFVLEPALYRCVWADDAELGMYL